MRSASRLFEDVDTHQLEWNPSGCDEFRTPESPAPSDVRDVALGMAVMPPDGFPYMRAPQAVWLVDWGDQAAWPSGAYRAVAIHDGAVGGSSNLLTVPGPQNPICVPEPDANLQILVAVVTLAILARWRRRRR